MRDEKNLNTIPVGPLGLIPLAGCAEMGKKVDSVIMFPVMALISICITVFVGRIVYKEKLTKINVVGVILGLIAVIVLSVFTPETLSEIFS